MKTYILKYPVYNSIDFPEGSIVGIIRADKFRVTKGDLTGEVGEVAEGLNGWLIENTPSNRKKINGLLERRKAISALVDSLNKDWDDLETVVVGE